MDNLFILFFSPILNQNPTCDSLDGKFLTFFPFQFFDEFFGQDHIHTASPRFGKLSNNFFFSHIFVFTIYSRDPSRESSNYIHILRSKILFGKDEKKRRSAFLIGYSALSLAGFSMSLEISGLPL